MKISKLIIHEIRKEQQGNSVLSISNDLISLDEKWISLLETLQKSFKGDKQYYAVFDEVDGNYFPVKYLEYKKSERQNSDFVSMSQSLIKNLNSRITNIPFARGGYFLFTEYTNQGKNFIAVYLIRDVEGRIFKKSGTQYRIETIEYLETKNMAMACRINENKHAKQEGNYLTFIGLKQQKISNYFFEWLAVKQLESSAHYTQVLYNLINKIPRPIDKEKQTELSINEFRERIYSYVTSSPTKNINLKELGEHFYQDENHITNFAEDHNFILDSEFRYNTKELNKFTNVRVKIDGINLNFSRGAFGSKIKISKQNKNIIMIESSVFANALRKEIGNDKN